MPGPFGIGAAIERGIVPIFHMTIFVRPGQMIVAPTALPGDRSTVGSAPKEILPALTPRELEVLKYLGRAMPTVGIARVMGITEHTCRSHLKALHNKLGASTQLEAVIKAQQLGLISTS